MSAVTDAAAGHCNMRQPRQPVIAVCVSPANRYAGKAQGCLGAAVLEEEQYAGPRGCCCCGLAGPQLRGAQSARPNSNLHPEQMPDLLLPST